jgi:hypothetical protein
VLRVVALSHWNVAWMVDVADLGSVPASVARRVALGLAD